MAWRCPLHPLKADIGADIRHVCFVPEADVAKARDWTCAQRGLPGMPLIHIKDLFSFRILLHTDATALARTIAQTTIA